MKQSEKIIQRNRDNAEKRLINLSGKTFGRIFVINRSYTQTRATMWNCKCECGTLKVIDGKHLKSGKILSCGCLCLEINSKRMKGNTQSLKHGLTNHPLRSIRKAMTHRCYNSNNKFYKNYGERGIKVCDEWKESLQKFVEWSLSNGWEKGLSIDRKDNNGDYTPDNCHWITRSKNSSKNCILGKLRKEKCDRIRLTSQL